MKSAQEDISKIEEVKRTCETGEGVFETDTSGVDI